MFYVSQSNPFKVSSDRHHRFLGVTAVVQHDSRGRWCVLFRDEAGKQVACFRVFSKEEGQEIIREYQIAYYRLHKSVR